MRILVGYDGSKVADDVIKLANKHAQAFKAEVHIVTSLEQGAGLKKEDIDKAESKLEKLSSFFLIDPTLLSRILSFSSCRRILLANQPVTGYLR